MKKFGVFGVLMQLVASIGVQAADEVIVPVPLPLKQFGQLTVVGTPGAGQRDTFKISRCQKAADGSLAKFGCVEVKDGSLNERISLSVGTYRIEYSQMTSRPVEIRNGQTSYIALKKLVVPKIDGSYSFNVFKDFTNREEQDRKVQNDWSEADRKASFTHYCFSAENKKNARCKGWESNDLRIFRDGYVFGANGDYGYYILDGGLLIQVGRLYVIDPKDGEFVSVLPGVYGVSFSNKDGIIQDVYGIEVR